MTGIASGGLRASPALGRRLQAPARPTVAPLVTAVRARFRKALARLPEVLAAEPERARAALQEVLGHEITLRPAAGGGYLEAEVGIEVLPMAAAGGAMDPESMVAGARYRDYRQMVI